MVEQYYPWMVEDMSWHDPCWMEQDRRCTPKRLALELTKYTPAQASLLLILCGRQGVFLSGDGQSYKRDYRRARTLLFLHGVKGTKANEDDLKSQAQVLTWITHWRQHAVEEAKTVLPKDLANIVSSYVGAPTHWEAIVATGLSDNDRLTDPLCVQHKKSTSPGLKRSREEFEKHDLK
jgi:hypothetical protein